MPPPGFEHYGDITRDREPTSLVHPQYHFVYFLVYEYHTLSPLDYCPIQEPVKDQSLKFYLTEDDKLNTLEIHYSFPTKGYFNNHNPPTKISASPTIQQYGLSMPTKKKEPFDNDVLGLFKIELRKLQVSGQDSLDVMKKGRKRGFRCGDLHFAQSGELAVHFR
ncbi:hypothetical protein CEXT_649141 [Caerostris extrusa]|uniref:Uncharacterized protein n=1 Tax=Caerostris extrusa TaxID=172846 RepID=A0AAV4NPR0_CAEEX|nr:hypothetical protein CEXT_649141 [Caerostris extrusa]